MFEDCILESSDRLKTHRGWATLASSTLQTAFLALLVLLPILRPEALPRPATDTTIVAQLPRGTAGQPHTPAHQTHRSAVIARSPDALLAPTQIPPRILPGDANQAPPSDPAAVGTGGTGSPFGVSGAAPGLSEVLQRAPVPPVAPPKRIVISVLNEGNLVYRVEPAYPPLAKTAGIQGDVVLHAIISRDGTIGQLQILSGHPMLLNAAFDAVRQWRYRPYLLNGQPVEVETQITVRFLLSRR